MAVDHDDVGDLEDDGAAAELELVEAALRHRRRRQDQPDEMHSS